MRRLLAVQLRTGRVIVVGVDPGYANLGFSRVAHEAHARIFIEGGNETTPAGMPLTERMARIADRIQLLTGDVFCLEEQGRAWAGKQGRRSTNPNAVTVREVCGMVRFRARSLGARLIVVGPQSVRSRLGLPQGAEKKAVHRMVRLLVQGVPEKLSEHALDALGIGVAGARELVFPA